MSGSYPSRFGTIQEWCLANGIGVQEGRRRFAQYAVLSAVADVAALRRDLVLKGGNALDFKWQPNRSTLDLDFSVDMAVSTVVFDEHHVRTQFESGLRSVSGSLGVTLAVHRVRQNPPGELRRFATFQITIGYALADETSLRGRMATGLPSSHTVAVEISLNEPQCATTTFALDDTRTLRIGTLEDIIAEKLRALLQQPIRRRDRRQDLLDIAVVLVAGHELDRGRVATFLLEKAAARSVPVSRMAFRDPEVTRRAAVDYAALSATTRTRFVPYDEALATVLAFVDELPIPER